MAEFQIQPLPASVNSHYVYIGHLEFCLLSKKKTRTGARERGSGADKFLRTSDAWHQTLKIEGMGWGLRGMSLAVRAVSFTDDRQEMLGLLTRNFGAGQEKPFEWRHINNPAGRAWSWLAYDGNKTAVATASVFPRRIFVAGKRVLCGQVGGFAVDAGYRSLGPALLLQRATFEPVNSGALAFCYDCPPHDRGMSTFARLGMSPSCEMIRWALPLRSEEFLQKRLGKSIWTKPVVAAANILLATRRARRLERGIEIAELSGAFGDEFSELDRLVPCNGVIRTSRSAELLNWRYRENPAWDTQVLLARRGGELLGFLTLRQFGGRAYILDVFGIQLNATGPALLEAAIEVCRRRNVYSLHGFCPRHSELEPLFRAVGFRQRDRDARVVAYEKPGAGPGQALNHGLRWNLSHLDSTV